MPPYKQGSKYFWELKTNDTRIMCGRALAADTFKGPQSPSRQIEGSKFQKNRDLARSSAVES